MDSNDSINAIKEPRGFIRILQLVIRRDQYLCHRYLSYAHSRQRATFPAKSKLLLSLLCSLSSADKRAPICGPTRSLYGDFSASAQFFVFVGVISFLYCIALLLLYTVLHNHYDADDRIKKADFLSSCFVVFMWLLGSIAWASGVDQLKRYTSGPALYNELCGKPPSAGCKVDPLQTYAGLNISLIFGFANVALWASSLWFLWKETPWFQHNNNDLLADSGLPAVDGAPL
ncbi:unnamed protein product [Dibothriocephalus latus]|uniref:MARVEL domain-containing protein n=1 Tax=Dibothriocephalus latus TaxID=60516 RepID=A0A3P7L723_DIBLA|nr:unnamed protein product [Dibothriocephalus latus]